ncbi:hypothetical protein ACFL4E_00295 [Candidatus Omnitrophota bacterium]
MPRKKTKKLNCCEKCQNYWSCETKWYRGEHNKENICCPLCNFYESCWGVSAKKSIKTSKTR